jgi:hypothetical protein
MASPAESTAPAAVLISCRKLAVVVAIQASLGHGDRIAWIGAGNLALCVQFVMRSAGVFHGVPGPLKP